MVDCFEALLVGASDLGHAHFAYVKLQWDNKKNKGLHSSRRYTDNICDNKFRIKKESCIFIDGGIELIIFFMNKSNSVTLTVWRIYSIRM